MYLLRHQTLLFADIGENVKGKFDKIAEDDKQRAIRATEEVVRREEKQECNRLLEEARIKWLKERDILLRECEEKRQQSVMIEKESLKCRLREEFDDRVAQIQLSHETHLKDSVSRTWSKAEQVKDQIVDRVRAEENMIAEQIASELAEEVQREREDLLRQAAEEKRKALNRQREDLLTEHKTQLLLQEQDMHLVYKKKVAELCEQYEAELMASQQLLEEKKRQLEVMQKNLKLMTGEKDSWETKYNALKIEFSDFIAQFPGFDADFLLK